MRGDLTLSAHHGCSLLYMHLYAKRSTSDRPLADSLHGPFADDSVQLLHEPSPESLFDLLLRLAPGWDRLFQQLASLRRQAKRLRAAVLIGHNFQPTTSLHSFDVAA